MLHDLAARGVNEVHVLAVGCFGFNVISAQTVGKLSSLVAVNSLMAMVGGTLAALLLARTTPALCTTALWLGWWLCARGLT